MILLLPLVLIIMIIIVMIVATINSDTVITKLTKEM